MRNRIQLKISLTVSKRKRRSRIRKEIRRVIATAMIKGLIILRKLKIRRNSVEKKRKMRKVIKNPNTIIEETSYLKRRNKESLKLERMDNKWKILMKMTMMIVVMIIRIQNLNQKRKNLRRSKEMIKIVKAMNQAKRIVMGHSKT
jgi:hypothetical protein